MSIKCVYKANNNLETSKINPMMLEFFLKDLPVMEESALVMKDSKTRYAGIYDAKSGNSYFFQKSMVYNDNELNNAYKNGICKFAYYYIGSKIVGAIVVKNKEYAMRTLKWMEKQQKNFIPEYYMLEIIDSDNPIYINVDTNGNVVYENFERDCESSPDNIKNLIEKSLSDNINNEINEVLYLAGVK